MPTDPSDSTPDHQPEPPESTPGNQRRFVEVPWEPRDILLLSLPKGKGPEKLLEAIEAYQEDGNTKMAAKLEKLLKAKGSRGARKKWESPDLAVLFEIICKHAEKNPGLSLTSICANLAKSPLAQRNELSTTSLRLAYGEYCKANKLNPKTAYRRGRTAEVKAT